MRRHLHGYVENFEALHVVHHEIFPFDVDYYRSFSPSRLNCGEQFGTTILYNWKSDLNYRESYVQLVVPRRGQSTSDRTVLNWFHKYERGKLNVFVAYRSGRSRTAVIEETINALRLLIEDDSHIRSSVS